MMKFNTHILKNGLRLVTIPMQDNPAVTVLVMVETGSKYETKEKNGISHFLEHMVFKGTPKRPKAIDISRELESLGAQYNAFTSQEFTGYYAKVSPEHIDTALDVVSDIYLNPLLDTGEIEKEKGVIVEEIRMYQDVPQRDVHDVFMNLMYGDQPAGWKIAGTEANVKSFDRRHFVDYMKEHYVAAATTVIISGSFDEKSAVEKAENLFTSLSTGPKSSKQKVVESQSKPMLALKHKVTDQTHLVLGVRSYDALSKKDTAISVLATILGKGMSSRLFQKMREEMGLGYYVHADQDAYTDHGIFAVSAGIDTTRIDEAIATLLAECAKLTTDLVDPAELKKAQDYMAGSYLLGLETSDARAEYAAIRQIIKGKIESPDEEIMKIRAVTAEQVRDIAREIFVDEKLNLAIIGPYKPEDSARFEKILTFGQKN